MKATSTPLRNPLRAPIVSAAAQQAESLPTGCPSQPPPQAADLAPALSRGEVRSRNGASQTVTAHQDAGHATTIPANEAADPIHDEERRRGKDNDAAEKAWKILGNNPRAFSEKFRQADKDAMSPEVRRSVELRLSIWRADGGCGVHREDGPAGCVAARVEALARKCEAPRELGGLGIRSAAHLDQLAAISSRRAYVQSAANALLESVQNLLAATLIVGLLKAAAASLPDEQRDEDMMAWLIPLITVLLDGLRRGVVGHYVSILPAESRSPGDAPFDWLVSVTCRTFRYGLAARVDWGLGVLPAFIDYMMNLWVESASDVTGSVATLCVNYGSPRGLPSFLHAVAPATRAETKHVESLENHSWSRFCEAWTDSLRARSITEDFRGSATSVLGETITPLIARRMSHVPFAASALVAVAMPAGDSAQRRRLQREIDESLYALGEEWKPPDNWRPGDKLPLPPKLIAQPRRSRPAEVRMHVAEPDASRAAELKTPGLPASQTGTRLPSAGGAEEAAASAAATRGRRTKLKSRPAQPALLSITTPSTAARGARAAQVAPAQADPYERRIFRHLRDVQQELSQWGYRLRNSTGSHFTFTCEGEDKPAITVARGSVERLTGPSAAINNTLQRLWNQGVRPRARRSA